MKRLLPLVAAAALGAAASAAPLPPETPAAASAPAAYPAAPLPPDTPLVTDGPVKVDVRDLDAYMLRMPEDIRATVRTSYDRVAAMVDSVFVTRAAAFKAREAGLDKDPDVQRRLQQVQEGFLAELYLQTLRKEADKADLTQRARELYEAEPAKFTSPEQVKVQQILVSLWGRTRDMARERAGEVAREAAAPKADFLKLAAKYTDDPDKEQNGGDLGYYPPAHFPGPVAEAIAKLDTKGQIAGPIETPRGFYIVRFVDRKPGQLAKFEAVRKGIIAEERERLEKERLTRFVNEVRGSKTVVLYQKNVDAYVIPVDMAKLQEEKTKILEEMQKKALEEKKEHASGKGQPAK